MKIGCMINLNTMEGLAEKFRFLQQEELASCQLSCWDPSMFTDENAEIIRQCAAQSGVRISAFWCGWTGPIEWNFYGGQQKLGLVPQEYQAQRIRELCAGGDFAKKLGVCDVVTHMGFIPEDPNDARFLPFCDAVRQVAAHLRENGQYLLFETGQETPVTMLRCFETIGLDNLGVNLDTGNCILYGRANPVDALDVIGPYVRGIHAKDAFYPTNGHNLGTEVCIGTGKVDFEALLRGMKALGRDCDLTIEREIDGQEQLTYIRRAKQYLETLILRVNGR